MIKWLICFSAMAWTATRCEPPVNSYLPPTREGAGGGRPGAEYGPPSAGGSPQRQRNNANRPGSSNQPQDSYSLPGQFPPNAPPTQYGLPGTGQGAQQRGLNSPQQTPGQGFGGSSSGSGFGPSSPGRGFGSPNQPSQEYGAPNQFGGGNEGNNQNRLGNRPLGGSGVEMQNNLLTSYGAPNQQNNGRSLNQNPFGQDNSRSNQRPETSYGAPLVGGIAGSRGNNGGSSRNAQKPESSYGPPPFGDVSGGGNGFRQGQQNAGQRPDSSYGPPSSIGGANSGRPSSNVPSSSYGTPDIGGDAGNRYQDGSNDESNEPAKYEFNYDVDNSQTGTKFGHSEQRDGDVTTGEYNVVLPDGRRQVVEYEAGLQGYKPQIRYEGKARGDSGFGAGGGQAGGQGYPSGPNANSFQDSSNDIGYPQNGQGRQDGSQQQPGDETSGYPRGGPSGARGQGQGNPGRGSSGYSRGGPSAVEANDFGSPVGGYPGRQGGSNDVDSIGADNGYRRGPQESGFPSRGPQAGSSGYPRGQQSNTSGNQDNQGYPRGDPSQGSNSGRGGQRGGFYEDSSSGSNGYPREGPRGQSSGNRSFGGGNDGEHSGYPSGGPDGPRGSGY